MKNTLRGVRQRWCSCRWDNPNQQASVLSKLLLLLLSSNKHSKPSRWQNLRKASFRPTELLFSCTHSLIWTASKTNFPLVRKCGSHQKDSSFPTCDRRQITTESRTLFWVWVGLKGDQLSVGCKKGLIWSSTWPLTFHPDAQGSHSLRLCSPEMLRLTTLITFIDRFCLCSFLSSVF